MTWAERILWSTLVIIGITAAIVVTGHAPHESKLVILTYLGTLSAATYISGMVSIAEMHRDH
jgi:hypothetical protein